jgi:digeranylgeranylglycerophospholipid reductase
VGIDVLVVGAGPVGLYLAHLLEKSGLSARVLEEHGEIGRPNHCSGLISKNLDLFVQPKKEWIEHRVSGALIKAGSSSIRLKKHGTAAYVIDRSLFDLSLAQGLESQIRLGERVEGVSAGEEGVTVKTNKGVYKADMLIGCDGANSVVARHFGSRPKKLLQGVIAVTQEENRSDCVEISVDKALANGFFWKIPRGEITEYGMFSGNADFLSLEKFFGLKDPYERRAGLIPMGPGKTFFPRTLLVGDSAGMSKPWSGGGIIFGFTAARIAARVVVEAFREDDFSGAFLARYESGWKRAFGRQIQAGMLGRKVFERMDNQDIETVLKCLRFFMPIINRMDMDFLVKN